MSDPQPFPDQSTTDALSALSALASQASLHPAYEFSANEEGGGSQNALLPDGEGQPPPPSSTTNLTHLNHHNQEVEGVEGEWDAAQEQTFAEMVAENEAHREQEAIEVSASGLGWDGDHGRTRRREGMVLSSGLAPKPRRRWRRHGGLSTNL